MCSSEKTTTVPSESWRQMSMDNGAEVDNGKDVLTSSSTIWRSCDSRRWTQRIVLNEEGEPVWLTLTSGTYSLKGRVGKRERIVIRMSNI